MFIVTDLVSLKGGCTGSSESSLPTSLVKIPHCWKSHVTAQIYLEIIVVNIHG